MKKSKNAFTMIELIFVIVILGVLAAVAIPKLFATSRDAKASARAHTMMTAVTEIAQYAVSKGKTESNLSIMSTSIYGLVNRGQAILGDYNATISVGSVSDCGAISIVRDATDDTLIVIFGSAND